MSTPVPFETLILTLVGFFRGSRGVGILQVNRSQPRVCKEKNTNCRSHLHRESQTKEKADISQTQAFGFPSQQSPGGMGFPCGQVFGCPKKVQMRWSSSGLMICSNLQACVCASDSSMEKVSLKRRSARR